MNVSSGPHRTGVLVVGGGEAGLALATELRDLGYTEQITIVGQEPYPPYQRPPLSKGFLHGTDDEETLALRSPNFLSERRITVWDGLRVEALELGDNGGTATLKDGSALQFTRLALTTGATARRLAVAGMDLRGVHTLRTIQDAIALRAALDSGSRVVVIGGGFIGLEVAAAARAKGASVTVVESTSRLLQRVCAPPLSAHCLQVHCDAGIEVLLEATVTALSGDGSGSVAGVELADGRTLPATVVVVGVGAVPATELAEKAGLSCRNGIVVDNAGQTTHRRVVAAGDCTVQPHPHLAGELLRIESVNNAVEQAKSAAHTLLGLKPPSRGVPWFWSDQGNIKIQMAGISHGHDEWVVRAEPGRLTVLYFRRGRLIAADVANNPRDFMAVKRALGDGLTIEPAHATDRKTPLKELLQRG
ncbi:FAD-dependent oxidoreductase [Micromonospora sp. CPCC 206060]|uniref:NAD(P)/FAD-dependent oxidoreductase n=1 Tax=Micromonospora sp. CPCC 206060 TaxID=3122406 RepID=UPI002FF26737